MAVCTFGYPGATDFNTAVQNVLGYITGSGGVDTACAVHCGWVVQGYFQNMLLPCDGTHPVMGANALVCKTEADLVNYLKMMQTSHAVGAAPAGFDWGSLLSILIPLLLEWLKPKPTP